MELAETISNRNNVTLGDAKDILEGAESALEAAENAFKVKKNVLFLFIVDR